MSSIVTTLPHSREYCDVFQDILSQAITGELIGMANYAAMCALFDNSGDQIDAVEHAANERSHAAAFEQAARDLGVQPIVDIQAPYWRRLREAFLRQVARRDSVACLIVQEVMLESLAVSMYHAVSRAAHGRMALTFKDIGDEEQRHIDHAVHELTLVREKDPPAFDALVETLHDEVMTIVAEMLAARDTVHCGLCHGDCIKGSLHHVGLDRATMRGEALNCYLRTLDRLGIPGERSLAWVARLPV